MTHDFWQALQGWENLGLAGLGSLAENSVRWAAYEDQTAKDWIKDVKDGIHGDGMRGSRLRNGRPIGMNSASGLSSSTPWTMAAMSIDDV